MVKEKDELRDWNSQCKHHVMTALQDTLISCRLGAKVAENQMQTLILLNSQASWTLRHSSRDIEALSPDKSLSEEKPPHRTPHPQHGSSFFSSKPSPLLEGINCNGFYSDSCYRKTMLLPFRIHTLHTSLLQDTWPDVSPSSPLKVRYKVWPKNRWIYTLKELPEFSNLYRQTSKKTCMGIDIEGAG